MDPVFFCFQNIHLTCYYRLYFSLLTVVTCSESDMFSASQLGFLLNPNLCFVIRFSVLP